MVRQATANAGTSLPSASVATSGSKICDVSAMAPPK